MAHRSWRATPWRTAGLHACVACGLLFFAAAAPARECVLELTATAYNSVPEQTDDTPDIAAWGDVLEPDMKVIAVSRDLLAAGLSYGVPVTIDGLPGEYVVLDKMATRWRNRIDIFMGKDVQAAREWGNRKVTIRYWTVDETPSGPEALPAADPLIAPGAEPAPPPDAAVALGPATLPPGLPELADATRPAGRASLLE